MEERIQIEDLRKRIVIENQYGQELGAIYIAPDDYNILERAKTAENNIQKLIKEIESKTAGEEDYGKIGKILHDVDQEIKKELDVLFDCPVSSQIFGNTHCLSTKNGKYFVENLLEGIMPVIQRTVEQETKESQKRMDKYLQEYLGEQA